MAGVNRCTRDWFGVGKNRGRFNGDGACVHRIYRCRVDMISLCDGGATGTFSRAVVNKSGDRAR